MTASHDLLDAFTNGGMGVGFFIPLDNDRYFFPWRPIRVSPIRLSFFSEAGLRTFGSELLWVWLPTVVVVAPVLLYRRLRGKR